VTIKTNAPLMFATSTGCNSTFISCDNHDACSNACTDDSCDKSFSDLLKEVVYTITFIDDHSECTTDSRATKNKEDSCDEEAGCVYNKIVCDDNVQMTGDETNGSREAERC